MQKNIPVHESAYEMMVRTQGALQQSRGVKVSFATTVCTLIDIANSTSGFHVDTGAN